MPLTSDSHRDASIIEVTYQWPVKELTAIPKAAATGLQGGYAVNVSDSPGIQAVGVQWKGVDNSTGSNGDKYTDTQIRYGQTFETTGADQTWVGKIAYFTDNETVALTSTSKVKAGLIMAVNSATSIDVWMHPFFYYMNDIGVSEFPINITNWFSHLGAPLGVVEATGTFNYRVGTDVMTIESRIANNETDVSEMKAQVSLPANYIPGTSITVRIPVKLFGAGTDNGSTIDLEAFKITAGAIGSDICATAAQTLTTAWVNYDFTITPTGLTGGDELSLVLTGSIIESATADLQAEIAKISLWCNAIG